MISRGEWFGLDGMTREELRELADGLLEENSRLRGLVGDRPLFMVVDRESGKEADPEEVALDGHDFASRLIYCDMDGWYVDCYGNLALLDECGSYDMPTDDRFELVWDRKALNMLLAGLEE